jgi:hypothetical protein
MSNSKIYFLVNLFLFSTLLISIVLAENDIEKCVRLNKISCENCIHINVSIINGEETNEFFVGDYFYYNITILNIGNETINSQLTVNVYNPQRESIGANITFPINLEPNKTTFLFPNRTENMKNYYIYNFDSVGSYKITVFSDNLHFYHFYPKIISKDGLYFSCKYIDSTWYYPIYFDAMPKWNYEWEKEMRDQIDKYEKTIEKLKNETEQMKNATEEMRDISKRMEISNKFTRTLSMLVLFLTIVNVTCTIYSLVYSAQEERSLFNFVLLLLLVALILILFNYFIVENL